MNLDSVLRLDFNVALGLDFVLDSDKDLGLDVDMYPGRTLDIGLDMDLDLDPRLDLVMLVQFCGSAESVVSCWCCFGRCVWIIYFI